MQKIARPQNVAAPPRESANAQRRGVTDLTLFVSFLAAGLRKKNPSADRNLSYNVFPAARQADLVRFFGSGNRNIIMSVPEKSRIIHAATMCLPVLDFVSRRSINKNINFLSGN